MQTKVPFEVVKTLLDTQNAFNEKLIQLLGAYLEKASETYERALNPPIHVDNTPMTYSSSTDEADDLMHQIETGQLNPDQIPDALRRLVHDTDISMDPT